MSKLKGIATVDIPVATETWIATALLHREHPDRDDFTIQEIIARVQAENLTGSLRPGVGVHASTHCVANREPRPARHRMLYATGKRTRPFFGRATRRICSGREESHRSPSQYRRAIGTCWTGIATNTANWPINPLRAHGCAV